MGVGWVGSASIPANLDRLGKFPIDLGSNCLYRVTAAVSREGESGEDGCLSPYPPSGRPNGAGMLEGRGVTPCPPRLLALYECFLSVCPSPGRSPKRAKLFCSSDQLRESRRRENRRPPEKPIQQPQKPPQHPQSQKPI